MKLKLKEDPREWLKFTAVMALVAGLIVVVLLRRHVLSARASLGIGIALGASVIVCWRRPQWFRGFYRGGMAASFRLGQILGWVWLTLFFLFVLTPLGVALRICGKDLLGLRRPNTGTYWNPSKTNERFDRQF